MISRNRFQLTVVLCLGATILHPVKAGDDDGSSKPNADQAVRERNLTTRLANAELKRWRFVSKRGRAANVSAEPAMRWSHFDMGRYYGDLYMVTAQERPVAIFAYFRWFHPTVREYVCITALDSDLVGIRNGKTLWRPRNASVEWNPLPKVQPPRNSQPIRLTQMRRLAHRFSGEVSDKPVPKPTTMKKLRLLTQPIYRYSSDDTDGAIFAFANGTTPAVLLCVEADLDPQTSDWRYGFARRWSWESRMSLDGEQVWVAPSVRPPPDSDASYFITELRN